MDTYIKYGIATGVAIAIGYGLYLYYQRKKILDLFPKKSISNCKVENLVFWFKEKDRLETLKNNENALAVAIKKPNPLAKDISDNEIILAIFDESESEIKEGLVLSCEQISNEISEMFGNKDMIVLK